MRLLRTIGGLDVTGQERAALNKLTMPRGRIRGLCPQPGCLNSQIIATAGGVDLSLNQPGRRKPQAPAIA